MIESSTTACSSPFNNSLAGDGGGSPSLRTTTTSPTSTIQPPQQDFDIDDEKKTKCDDDYVDVDGPSKELRSHHIFEYDTSKYDFRELITDILLSTSNDNIHDDDDDDDAPAQPPLERIHELLEDSTDKVHVLTFAADQNLPFHRKYYNSPKLPQMLKMYRDFIQNVAAPMFVDSKKLVVQCKPTFRVHLPNNTAVPSDIGGDPTKPGLHCDSDYNHSVYAVNLWVPVTDVNKQNGIWLESKPLQSDYQPIAPMTNGQCLRFWGAKCRHYNTYNTNGQTRVSFDFRVVKYSDWQKIPKQWFKTASTVQAKMKMDIGGYYMLYDKETQQFSMTED